MSTRSTLAIVSLPPCRSISALTILRPSPVPPYCGDSQIDLAERLDSQFGHFGGDADALVGDTDPPEPLVEAAIDDQDQRPRPCGEMRNLA